MRTRENTATARRTAPARVHPRHDDPATREMALLAVRAALDKKALAPVLLDIGDLASYADYVLIVSGRSDRQVESIADGIIEALRARGHRLLGVEGIGGGTWTLIDFGDVIVHVFYHPARDHYDLESLWIDATPVPIEVPPEARVTTDEPYL